MTTELDKSIATATEQYGPDIVAFAWINFFVGLLPFFAAIMREGEFIAQAKALGLTEEQAFDSIKLIAALKKSEEPHHAWIAAEIIGKLVNKTSAANIIAAIHGKTNVH